MGGGNASMTIFIGGDNSDFIKKWESTKRALRKGLGADAMAASENVAMGLAGVVAAMGAMGIASVKMAGDMQASKRAFTTMLGDAQKAEKFLGDLAKFAAETPFDLPGLTTASKKLLAFGFAAEDIIPIMASIGDAAAMLGIGQEGIDRLTLAIGQMRAKGKVSGEEMRQLAEAGIPAWQMLATAIGVSIPEAMDRAEKGAIDSTTGINAILMGMQSRFKGGMEGLAKEIPGLWSTIKDNTAAVAREIGDKIIEALDIKTRMQGIVDYLDNFASYVKSNGLNEALKNLIPKELSLAIFAIGGAITAVAIPALATLAINAALAVVPFLPLIAAGAALGAVAWVIWQAWEPLGQLFTSTWGAAVAYTYKAWAEIKGAVLSGVAAVLGAIQPFLNLFGGGIQSAVADWMSSLAEKITVAGQAAAEAGERAQAVQKGMASAFQGIGSSLAKGADEIRNSISGLNTTFTGLHGAAGAAGDATGKAAKEAAKAWEKLEKKAEQVSKSIEDQWVQTTKTELEQLDIWKAQQLQALDETAAANENYQRDLERVAATYSVRRRKILQDEAKNAISIYRQIADMARSFSEFNISFNLKGSSAKEFDITKGARDSIRDMERQFEDMAIRWDSATEKEKAAMRDAFIQNGILFKETETGKISFADETARRRVAIEKKAEDDIAEYRRTSQSLQDDLDAARREGDIQAYANLLSTEQALFAQDLAGRQEYIDAYYAAWQATHRSAMSYMAEAFSTTFSGLTTFFSDALSGVKSWGDALGELGNTFKKMLANWIAQWIAGQISMALFGKAAMTAAATTAAVTGAAVAASWAGAAAAVSLATFGANSGPAMAGMTAAYGLSYGLAVPQLASGGITTGPTLAEIGEGHYREAVLPLDRKTLERVGLGSNGTTVIQNNYGDINTKVDYDAMQEDLGNMVRTAMMGV